MGVNEFYALKTEVYLGNTLSLCVLPVKPLKEISPVCFFLISLGSREEKRKSQMWVVTPNSKT